MTTFSAESFYDRYWQHRIARGDAVADNRVKLRHEQTAAFISETLPDAANARLLDLGCGDGVMGQLLKASGYDVTGVDVSWQALDVASRHYSTTVRMDVERETPPSGWTGSFDGVIALEMLEHLESPRRAIALTHELCRPGGVAAFSFPNLFSWKNRLAFMRGRWPNGYTTYDPREHLHAFELRAFKHWLRGAGFEIERLAITPDLPATKLLRHAVFRCRGLLTRLGPSLWAMQIALLCRKPSRG